MSKQHWNSLALAGTTYFIQSCIKSASNCSVCLELNVFGMFGLHARHTKFHKDWTPWCQVMSGICDKGGPS